MRIEGSKRLLPTAAVLSTAALAVGCSGKEQNNVVPKPRSVDVPTAVSNLASRLVQLSKNDKADVDRLKVGFPQICSGSADGSKVTCSTPNPPTPKNKKIIVQKNRRQLHFDYPADPTKPMLPSKLFDKGDSNTMEVDMYSSKGGAKGLDTSAKSIKSLQMYVEVPNKSDYSLDIQKVGKGSDAHWYVAADYFDAADNETVACYEAGTRPHGVYRQLTSAVLNRLMEEPNTILDYASTGQAVLPVQLPPAGVGHRMGINDTYPGC